MIKLSVNYSKKIPGEAQYSSEGASCSIEVEAADGVIKDTPQVRAKIEALFAEARAAVDQQLAQKAQPENTGKSGGNGDVLASNKQLQYLISLGKQSGLEFTGLQDAVERATGERDLYKLTRSQASRIIDSMKSE